MGRYGGCSTCLRGALDASLGWEASGVFLSRVRAPETLLDVRTMPAAGYAHWRGGTRVDVRESNEIDDLESIFVVVGSSRDGRG